LWDSGSEIGPGEDHVRDSAWRRAGLDLIVLLATFQAVPQVIPAAEDDRDHRDVQLVDEPLGDELADDRDATTDADIQTAGSLAGRLERLGRRRADEGERRAAP